MALPNVFQSIAPPAPHKYIQMVGIGSLCTFSYAFHKPGHDPQPVVLITDIWDFYIRGVNINYLTFPTIKKLLQTNCNNLDFSYQDIKGLDYIVSAFRQYKKNGIQDIKKLDCAFLLNVLASVRSLDPNEIEAIRSSVRDQLYRVTNPSAEPTKEMTL
jgi:hypothetical protein